MASLPAGSCGVSAGAVEDLDGAGHDRGSGEGNLFSGEFCAGLVLECRLVQCLPGVTAALDQGVEVGDAAADEDLILPPRLRRPLPQDG